MARQLPMRADLIEYQHAVAGHEGTLCDVDGELFIKPCTPAEIAFYESSIASHPQFAEYISTYLGTLTLDETQNVATIEEAGAALIAKHSIPEVVVPSKARTTKKIATNQAIVLENAAHGFVKPNILDVKLGVRLWADDAHPEKKTRFDKITEETTHKELGFRIAGMRVWQGHNAKGADIDTDGFKIYDKNYGRTSISSYNVHEAFRNFIFAASAGIDEELGKLVSQAFLADITRILEILEAQESRMFSSSLLFVFEGDGAALRAAMEEASGSPATLVNSDGDGDGFSEDEDGHEDPGPKIYAVKIIDFAHAEWTPGLGPDENSLTGVRSVVKILSQLGSE
ncbi:putative inositol polyphosphate multikinase [Amylocarpus encephaloides]|uniref:Kinase n=1 Tax=Amylocarpus encephaloides TaxID=45428 RepID=A0A9P8C6Z5_9HELO|nr:putative inositol polyphosphate multikinase [Amylocarpus encephaloides]